MLVTDAQVHVWSRVSDPARAHRPGTFGVDQLLPEMDAAGVDRAVLILPSWSTDDNDFAVAEAARCPDRLAVMARVCLEQPEECRWIEGWRDQASVLGVRLPLHTSGRLALLDQPHAKSFLQSADEQGTPVMAYAPGGTGKMAEVAETHPGIKLVFDHLNLPLDARDDAIRDAVDELLPLASLPNVAVKVSALPLHVSPGLPAAQLAEWLQPLHDAFGRERLFWGSDMTRLPTSYADAVRQITDVLAHTTGWDQDALMGRSLADWLHWPAASGLVARDETE